MGFVPGAAGSVWINLLIRICMDRLMQRPLAAEAWGTGGASLPAVAGSHPRGRTNPWIPRIHSPTQNRSIHETNRPKLTRPRPQWHAQLAAQPSPDCQPRCPPLAVSPTKIVIRLLAGPMLIVAQPTYLDKGVLEVTLLVAAHVGPVGTCLRYIASKQGPARLSGREPGSISCSLILRNTRSATESGDISVTVGQPNY